MSRKTSLLSFAKKINFIAKSISLNSSNPENSRVEIGQLLLRVRKDFFNHQESMFRKWCYEKVCKADGKPFSYITLKNYMKYANNPALTPKERERQKKYAQARSEAIKFLSGDTPINGANYSEQVRRLVYAWDHATDEARAHFMQIIKVVHGT